MRRTFADILYKKMKIDKNIWLCVGDLGYKMFDNIRNDFSDRFVNCGSAEFSMLGVACGLSLEGKRVFVYSITPFLLFRGAEMIRDYINHEKIPVILTCSGRDNDYEHDGFSHFAGDCGDFINLFSNIHQYWPNSKDNIGSMIEDVLKQNNPSFISLKR